MYVCMYVSCHGLWVDFDVVFILFSEGIALTERLEFAFPSLDWATISAKLRSKIGETPKIDEKVCAAENQQNPCSRWLYASTECTTRNLFSAMALLQTCWDLPRFQTPSRLGQRTPPPHFSPLENFVIFLCPSTLQTSPIFLATSLQRAWRCICEICFFFWRNSYT